MENRQAAVIASLITAILCGCPGLIGICFGSMTVFAGMIPSPETDFGGQSDTQVVLITGIAMLCLGLLFVAIPALVGYFTLRRKPLPSAEVIDVDESIPPPL